MYACMLHKFHRLSYQTTQEGKKDEEQGYEQQNTGKNTDRQTGWQLTSEAVLRPLAILLQL